MQRSCSPALDATTLSARIIPGLRNEDQTGIVLWRDPQTDLRHSHSPRSSSRSTAATAPATMACYAATLALNVAIRRASPHSRPSITGRAAAARPWRSRFPQHGDPRPSLGYLCLRDEGLPRPARTRASSTEPASSSRAPSPSTSRRRWTPPSRRRRRPRFGQVINASAFSTAPTLSLFGPQILRLTPQDTQARLNVESSAEGSSPLRSLRRPRDALTTPGGNDLHFTLPPSLLRRSAALFGHADPDAHAARARREDSGNGRDEECRRCDGEAGGRSSSSARSRPRPCRAPRILVRGTAGRRRMPKTRDSRCVFLSLVAVAAVGTCSPRPQPFPLAASGAPSGLHASCCKLTSRVRG